MNNNNSHQEEERAAPTPSTSTAVVAKSTIPPYGSRVNWRPTNLGDFADGGAYPEVHVAQYPLGRQKRTTNGNTLTLQTDADGNVRYDAIGESIQDQ